MSIKYIYDNFPVGSILELVEGGCWDENLIGQKVKVISSNSKLPECLEHIEEEDKPYIYASFLISKMKPFGEQGNLIYINHEYPAKRIDHGQCHLCENLSLVNYTTYVKNAAFK